MDKKLKELESYTKFLGEQLDEISKKVNESLMIANEYERKQIKMLRDVKKWLKENGYIRETGEYRDGEAILEITEKGIKCHKLGERKWKINMV